MYQVPSIRCQLFYGAERVRGVWWVERVLHQPGYAVRIGEVRGKDVLQRLHKDADWAYKYARAEEFPEVTIQEAAYETVNKWSKYLRDGNRPPLK